MQPAIVLQFDLRHSPDSTESASERYRACLDMVQWADNNPVSVVGFSEHHNTEDGFLSAPLMMAMAAASRTQRIRISVSALLLPLLDPVRVAEDIAVLDIVSQGRFSATVGLGYREVEYQTFAVDWNKRGNIFDRKLAVLLEAFKGEPFDYRGTTFQLKPPPNSPTQSLILVGGNSPAAARRAARFKLMFGPAIDDAELARIYHEECDNVGFKHGYVINPNEPSLTLLSHDPERAWQEVGHFLLYDATAYQQWQHPSRRAYAESTQSTVEGLRKEGKYRILTPQQAAEVIRSKGVINFSPLCGGVPIDFAWQSLELYADEVVPFLKD